MGEAAPVPPPVPVLIVDDQAPFRLAARALVGRLPGFAVVGEAVSGEEAVALARSLAPELVLMDIKLPGMDGLAACKAVLAERPDTVVLLLSTYDAPPGVLDGGAAAYVRKEDLAPSVVLDLWSTKRPGAAPPG
jgi:DNA-binding NarL/FixJ family response regulator